MHFFIQAHTPNHTVSHTLKHATRARACTYILYTGIALARARARALHVRSSLHAGSPVRRLRGGHAARRRYGVGDEAVGGLSAAAG
jgi:hypothetical protein